MPRAAVEAVLGRKLRADIAAATISTDQHDDQLADAEPVWWHADGAVLSRRSRSRGHRRRRW